MDDLSRARDDIAKVLRQVKISKQIQQGNNDNGEYAERIADSMALFKNTINFALNLQESTENESIRSFTVDFLGNLMPELERAAQDSQSQTLIQLNRIEDNLRQLIGTWNPEALEIDVIEEFLPARN